MSSIDMNFLLTLKINDYHVLVFFWNIFLALIPCWIVYGMKQEEKARSWAKMNWKEQTSFAGFFLLWFFFFPNTAYLITDIRHLLNYCDGDPGLLRVCKEQAYLVPLFFTYALIGVPTFYYGLRGMTKILAQKFHSLFERFFPLVMMPITSVGVMLGLVSRFNSWDIVSHPLYILETFFSYFADKIMLLNILSYTVMLGLIYYFIRLIKKW